MTYIKTVDSTGKVISVQAISAALGAPEGAVSTPVLGKNQSFITADEYQTIATQIRSGS